MPTVTIEGQVPTVYLPRGGRRTVELTGRVQRLIDRGYVTVVDGPAPETSPEPTLFDSRTAPVLPLRSAPKPAWRDYLDAVGATYNDDMTLAELRDLAWTTSGYEPPTAADPTDTPDV